MISCWFVAALLAATTTTTTTTTTSVVTSALVASTSSTLAHFNSSSRNRRADSTSIIEDLLVASPATSSDPRAAAAEEAVASEAAAPTEADGDGNHGHNNNHRSPPDHPAASSTTTSPTTPQLETGKGAQPPVYTNQFVIRCEGGEAEARKLALKHGFVYLDHILGDYYHLEHRRLSKRSLSATEDALDISIQDEPQVLLLERQVLKKRVKRDFLELPAYAALGREHNARPPVAQQPLQPQPQQQLHLQRHHQLLSRPSNLAALGGVTSSLQQAQRSHAYTRPANQAPATSSFRQQQSMKLQQQQQSNQSGGWSTPSSSLFESSATNSRAEPLDAAASSSLVSAATSGASPGFLQANAAHAFRLQSAQKAPAGAQLNNSSAHQDRSQHAHSSANRPFNDPSWPLMWYLDGGAKNGFDLNVMAAWKMGYTGKGIVITILDDGLEKSHPDLRANYDPLASFDINDDDADPMPRYDVNDTNRHGTRCAGEVAAVPDNNICSIGIAYNSRVGGVRMLDGDVTDAVEARSLALNNQHIHIYSASWGPDDNGKTVDGPGELATRAFIEGVTKGRQGLGSIFVFASGNGGREQDNCNCDGYTNSIWTLSISSATENGYVPWYIEACSSTLATTYSSGSYEERQIATTDLHHSCTSGHTGTSASAPLAAGICALVLESNPRLTWRDMQHIVVRTAKPANLVARDWSTNAVGRNVSHAFGYGLMDAAAMITLAKKWTTVPTQYTCQVKSPQMERSVPVKGFVELKLRAECLEVRYLEHVQSKITLSSSRRGDLNIYLISPHGTRSVLLANRPKDQAEQGFKNWPFMTVHHWGESPNGVWTLEVHNDKNPKNRAHLTDWTLILYGTNDDPNKHLDAAAMADSSQTQFLAQPPPHSPRPLAASRPASLPAGIQANIQKQQPTTTTAQQLDSNNSGGYPTTTSNMDPQPQQQPAVHPFGRPGAHWSHAASTAPPTSNNGAGSRLSVGSQSPAVQSTTPSSYVTTFKTLVSGAGDVGGSPAGTRLQQPQQPAKADFDLVSMVSSQTAANNNQQTPTTSTTSATNLSGGSSSEPGLGSRPLEEQNSRRPTNLLVATSAGSPPATSTSSPPTTNGTLFATGAVGEQEADAVVPIMKPPVGAHEQQASKEPTSTTPAPNNQQESNEQLDANQIDSKLLTKDYRSSGSDQQLQNANNSNTMNELDEETLSSLQANVPTTTTKSGTIKGSAGRGKSNSASSQICVAWNSLLVTAQLVLFLVYFSIESRQARTLLLTNCQN